MNDEVEIIRRAAERIADRNVALRSFLLRLLNPDDLGHAVTQEVRTLVSRELLGDRNGLASNNLKGNQ